MQTETLIIGGGLSGLGVAARLTADGRDFLLVEARDRLGGRILTERLNTAYFDLGPTWFWPGQPRIAALVNRLGLSRFDRFEGLGDDRAVLEPQLDSIGSSRFTTRIFDLYVNRNSAIGTDHRP